MKKNTKETNITDTENYVESEGLPTDSKFENKEDVLDLGAIVKKLWKYRKLYYIVLPIVFLLSCLHILTYPRYYTTQTSLAPELDQPSVGGNLSSIASSFGFDLSDLETSDAITPLLYPDLMDDNKFVADMFKIHVKTSKDTIDTDYFTYLTKYQKFGWVDQVLGFFKKTFSSEKKLSNVNSDKFNPYNLSRLDDEVVKAIRGDIKLSVDKKTGVISISATAQDPAVCKTLADSVTARLQKFIIKYRTSKAQNEADHYKKLMNEALSSYESARRKYAAYSDANSELILESVKSKIEDMENDMQLKYNQYTTLNTQYQAAMAKVLERTPAFTILKGADVPVKPAGPKRMIFVFIMTFMGFLLTSLYAYFCKE